MAKRNEAAVRLQTDEAGNVIAFPFAGFGIGTIATDQILLALSVFIPQPKATTPAEGSFQMQMTRDHARRLGEALLFAAAAVHIPDGQGNA